MLLMTDSVGLGQELAVLAGKKQTRTSRFRARASSFYGFKD